MSLEAIKLVAEAERYAQDIRTDTQAQIRKIKADGERDGRERLELAIGKATEETKRLMLEAEEKADKHSRKILEQSKKECETLKEKAADRLDKAVNLIVERIVVT
jgi:V/A-type H+-transporting ATPase subunit G/H